MENKRILISGGGIAGLTLAFWLRRYGFTPTVIEIAPGVRGGGYMIDFWGLGYDAIERMGIVEEVAAAHYEIPVLEFVDERDRVGSRLKVRKMREMIGWRHFNLLRSDLERVLYDQVKDHVDIRFATSIAALRATAGSVEVDFAEKGTETFDLVIGADGLRSNTRRLVFGPDDEFEKYLGYYVASFTLDNFTEKKDTFRLLTVPGKQVAMYAIAGNQLATYFLFAEPESLGHASLAERKEMLASRFAGVEWETPRLLQAMDASRDFYFDSVSQVRMAGWSSGRVALVGDACQCVSLISGQGSALAMAGAYVLAGELKRAEGRHAEAFGRYEAIMMPEIARKQKMAVRFASSFVPRSRSGIFFRDLFVGLMFLPLVSRYFIKQFLSDDLELEDYGGDVPASRPDSSHDPETGPSSPR